MPEMRECMPGKNSATTARRKAHRLEIAAAAIGRDHRDAHLRHDLQQALVDGELEVRHPLLVAHVEQPAVDPVEDRVLRQIGVRPSSRRPRSARRSSAGRGTPPSARSASRRSATPAGSARNARRTSPGSSAWRCARAPAPHPSGPGGRRPRARPPRPAGGSSSAPGAAARRGPRPGRSRRSPGACRRTPRPSRRTAGSR